MQVKFRDVFLINLALAVHYILFAGDSIQLHLMMRVDKSLKANVS